MMILYDRRNRREHSQISVIVYTLIANVKGKIRWFHHSVGSQHLHRCLFKYCYRFNRRFWELQMFNQILRTCVNTCTVNYSELIE
jgi:hypothetical protein